MIFFSRCGLRTRKQKAGMAKSERSSDPKRAMTWVKARGRNILPSIPCRAMIGMKVRAMMSSPKMLGLRTSRTACRTMDNLRAPGAASPRWR